MTDTDVHGTSDYRRCHQCDDRPVPDDLMIRRSVSDPLQTGLSLRADFGFGGDFRATSSPDRRYRPGNLSGLTAGGFATPFGSCRDDPASGWDFVALAQGIFSGRLGPFAGVAWNLTRYGAVRRHERATAASRVRYMADIRGLRDFDGPFGTDDLFPGMAALSWRRVDYTPSFDCLQAQATA